MDGSLFLPYPYDLDDIDSCIVQSNVLDNAIQACKSLDIGMEDISMCPGVSRGFSYDGNRERLSWERRVQKGTGLANIKKVAEKYGGVMRIETQENAFIF